MKTRTLTAVVIAAALVVAGAYGVYQLGMQRGMGMGGAPSAVAPGAPAAEAMAASAATEAVPQSIAQGEDATRRHITTGIKAGDVDPMTGIGASQFAITA